MNNGVMGLSASPFDMLLGFGGKQPAQGRSSPDDFGQLLSLFPQLQLSEMTLPGMTDGLNPEILIRQDFLPLTVGAGKIVIPQEFAEMAGLKQVIFPDTKIQSPLESELKSGHFAQADLVMVEGDENQDIFLRLKSMSDNLSQGLKPEAEVSEKNTIILPMQIRTVELNGKQLFADAVLKTAAGEDVSIRLKLDVTGNQNKTSGDGLIYVRNDGDTARHVKQLPELIRDLNVKLIAVEGIEENAQAMTKSALPRAVVELMNPKNINDAKLGITKETLPDVETLEANPKDISSKNGQVSKGLQNTNSGSVLNAETSAFEKLNGRVSETQVPTTSEITSSVSNNQGSFDQKLSTPTVKFFDLDFGLNQLKQNPGQKIRVQLSPARLGTMELSIASHRGHVTINLVLNSMQAKQAVERGLAHLESQLSASGIKVDTFQLHVNGPTRGESFAGHQHHFYQGDYGQHQQGQRFYRDMFEKAQNRLNQSGESFDRIMVDCLA
ncbi:MAG: flagellar hook-length control protein FliK [candidate division Zixibacteria bacterium]